MKNETETPPPKIVDVAELQARAAAVEAICRLPWWTLADAAEYMGCSAYKVRLLVEKGLIKRDFLNRTCREWVDEFMKQPLKGRIRSVRAEAAPDK